MSEVDVVKEWLQIAFDDLDTAQYLYDNKYPKPLEIICYHCQQSVEKTLKAFLCAMGIEVPKTHDTGLLCQRCTELESAFGQYYDDCDQLLIYATQTRYPSRMEILDSDAKRALRQAVMVYEFVVKKVEHKI